MNSITLGLGDPVAVSSVHGHGTGDLLDASLRAFLPDRGGGRRKTSHIKVAVIGKPNAGKSSLVNRIAGEERVIVSDIAGHHPGRRSTRDVDNDTRQVYSSSTPPGIRRKSKVLDNIERYSVLRAYMAVDRADVVRHHDRRHRRVHRTGQQSGGAMPMTRGRPASSRSTSGMRSKIRPISTMKEFTDKLKMDFSFMSYVPFHLHLRQDRPAGRTSCLS